jgi:metallo-beta-lactamase family protein
MRVEFFGAAGEVTGSCHLVHAAGGRVLLDCGTVQGGREERKRNAARFGFDAKQIDAMVLSHAHIDHVGRLPLLSRRGYRGRIHTQRATADLSRVMLEDALRLELADVERENRRRERHGERALQPLYTEDDVQRVLRQLVAVDYDEQHELLPGVRCRLRDAGHIIGAAIVELWDEAADPPRKLVFSGDIGPRGTPILRDPTPVEEADLVMLESTYGDRLHRTRSDTVTELGEILRRARREQGVVLMPAFAVGRTQEILYWLAQHYDEWDLGAWRIVLDSPMAARVLEAYDRHQDLFDDAAREVWNGRRHPFRMPNLRVVTEARDSQALNAFRSGVIIIAGSGMCNGGRIVHHLRHHLWRESTHVIFAGYQAAGTLGRELVDGARFVRIFGESIRVQAQRHTIGGLSAHADQAGLLEWYGHFRSRPPVYLVHGEDHARGVLAARLREQFGARVELTRPGSSAEV